MNHYLFVLVISVLSFNFATGKSIEDIRLESVVQPRLFEGRINQSISEYFAKLANSDPLWLATANYSVHGHSVEFRNLSVSGFSNVYATNIKLSGLLTWTLSLVLHAPRLEACASEYSLNGGVVYGNGNASILLEDVQVLVNAKINPFLQKVKDLSVAVLIGYGNASITGLFNNDEISKNITDGINQFLNYNLNGNEALYEKLSQYLLHKLQNH